MSAYGDYGWVMGGYKWLRVIIGGDMWLQVVTNKQRIREIRIKMKTHLIMVHVSWLVSCADSRKVCE